jgi:hypothetical protein
VLHLLSGFASPERAQAEAPTEAGASPAAKALGEKQAGAKAGEAAGRFARSLEKAREAREETERGAEIEKEIEKEIEQLALRWSKEAASQQEHTEQLLELLGGLNAEKLVRILMRIDPEDILHGLQAAGFRGQRLHSLLARAGEPGPAGESAKPGQNRSKLVAVLTALADIIGGQALAEALSGGTTERQLPSNPGRNVDREASSANRQTAGPEKSDKQPRVVVLDLRKAVPGSKEMRGELTDTKGGDTKLRDIKGSAAKADSVPVAERPPAAESLEKDMSVLFRAPFQDRGAAPGPEAGLRTARPATSFEQRFVPEVVKQTGIILKDGGAGEIRLVLKPENLGSVRIRLSMSESSLEGRIVVDNNSVKELVESSLDNLKNALRSEGYQTANLEVSVGHRRSGEGNQQAAAPLSGWQASGSEEFEKAVPLFLDMNPEYELVNVFA